MEEYKVMAVYQKGNDWLILYEDDNYDFVYIYDSRDKTWSRVPVWDYDLDEYDFVYLEEDYDIGYMSIENHKGIWNMINLNYEDYEHIDGMQMYFEYCQKHHITADLLIGIFHEEISDIFEWKYNAEELKL